MVSFNACDTGLLVGGVRKLALVTEVYLSIIYR